MLVQSTNTRSPFSGHLILHAVRRRSSLTCSAASEVSGDASAPKSDEELHKELVRSLEAKEMKWYEIPFKNIEQELALIDEYERKMELNKDDPWPKFLRAAAYEYWGQPQLALAQYAKTGHAGGLRRVPELWERRAYNAFKIGNVAAAHTYYEIALGLFYESAGNELHFVHWFHDHFKDHMPKWNGPPGPLQRGICKYCVGLPKEARTSFVPQIELHGKDMEHSLLWFLACAWKSAPGGMIPADARVAREALERGDVEWNPRLRLLLKLFHAAAQGIYGEVTAAEQELSDAIKADEKDDIVSHVYMALYHDTFTKDTAERDRALDVVTAIGSTPSPRDTENFLFHVAKNRMTIPKDGANPEVPEQAP